MADSAIDDLQFAISPSHRSGFVAVVGRPNVGKSTLINALLGEKVAIVSPKPQTTRNRLLGILTREDAQVIFLDTPGIHRPAHRLGELLLETAAATLPDADLALWVVDVTGRPNEEDRQVAALLTQTGALPVILALNQADRLLPQHVTENTAAYTALAPGAESLLVSAKRGDNLDTLLAKIIATLPPGPRYYPEDQFTDQQVRFMAAELVREQALLRLHDEVPHGIAVAVNEFKERNVPGASEVPGTSPAAMTYISATIYVEREAHKPILLGKGGEMLKAIGQGARREIETLLDTRVYLDLWVKVRPKWRTDEEELRRLGYESPVVRPRKGGERRQKRRTTR